MSWFETDGARNFAGVLSSIATVLGVILAAVGALKTLPRELAKWRNQRRLEQKAAAAAKALTSLIAFSDALLFFGNTAVRPNDEPPPKEGAPVPSNSDRRFVMFDRRIAEIASEMKAFHEA